MTTTFASGECQVCAWGESPSRGPTVTLRLHSFEELEPFRGLTLAKGGVRGDRFAYVIVRIQDDETLEGETEKPRHGFPLGLAGLAVRWCASEDYQQWMEREGHTADASEEASRQAILNVCAIQSRQELNTDTVAAAIFDEVFKLPYAASRKERGLDSGE